MPEVQGIDKLFSDIPRKRFGVFRKLGTFQMGFSHLGEDDIYFIRIQLGDFRLGVDKLGDLILLSGIYRTGSVAGRTRYYRDPYYIIKNPRTPAQQTNRGKYAAGVTGWQGLTDPQKEVYNQRAIGKKMSGYNLYLREFLLS